MSQVEIGELLYVYTVKITNFVEFGFSFETLMTGGAPPEGARFDVHFEGPISGKVNGRVAGIDHLYVRPDGRMELNIRGVIATDDGKTISLFADGVALPKPQDPVAELRENVTLFTSAQEYAWVNRLQVWGVGSVDLAQQVVHIKGYG